MRWSLGKGGDGGGDASAWASMASSVGLGFREDGGQVDFRACDARRGPGRIGRLEDRFHQFPGRLSRSRTLVVLLPSRGLRHWPFWALGRLLRRGGLLARLGLRERNVRDPGATRWPTLAQKARKPATAVPGGPGGRKLFRHFHSSPLIGSSPVRRGRFRPPPGTRGQPT